jgi:hypothetical protein
VHCRDTAPEHSLCRAAPPFPPQEHPSGRRDLLKVGGMDPLALTSSHGSSIAAQIGLCRRAGGPELAELGELSQHVAGGQRRRSR